MTTGLPLAGRGSTLQSVDEPAAGPGLAATAPAISGTAELVLEVNR